MFLFSKIKFNNSDLKKALIILICLCFGNIIKAQDESVKDMDMSEFNIFLFGESHFVNEKYVEILEVFYTIVNTREETKKITLVLELPVSLNYGLDALINDKDSSVFCNYFNYHLYAQKDEKPSIFWIDFKNLLLEIVHYCDEKNIELEIQCVDVERKFRRTVYTLFELYNKYNLDQGLLTEMMNKQIILDDDTTRQGLIQLCDDFLRNAINTTDSAIVTQIKKALQINCIHNCNEREVFMYNNFNSSMDVGIGENRTIVFGIFGLNHLVFSGHDIPEKYITSDNIEDEYHPFISLFDKKMLSKTFRIGITSFTMKLNQKSQIEAHKKIPALLDDEKEYLESLLKDKNRISLFPKDHKELSKFAKEIDYLILYKSSYYK